MTTCTMLMMRNALGTGVGASSPSRSYVVRTGMRVCQRAMARVRACAGFMMHCGMYVRELNVVRGKDVHIVDVSTTSASGISMLVS